MQLNYKYQRFTDFSLDELYAVLKLRSEVFVVEQDCVFLDPDGLDQACHHLSGYSPEGELAAYTRIVKPGDHFEEVSIGRVVTGEQFRGLGLGKAVMWESIKEIEREFGAVPIRIAAQQYLEKFYQELGFETVGEPYLWDGIDHIDMVRAAPEAKT